MTREERIEKHKILHLNLDQLVADWITHNPSKNLTSSTIMDLIVWSSFQRTNPSEEKIT